MVINGQAAQLTQLYDEHLKEIYRLGANIINQGEDGILMCLSAADRAMLSGEIMEKTGLSAGRVANILKQLETKGLIERRHDGSDRRWVHVTLTDTGRQRAAFLRKNASMEHESMVQYLGEEDAAEMLRLMRRLIQYAQEHLPASAS